MDYKTFIDKKASETLAVLEEAFSDYRKEAVVAELLCDDLMDSFFRLRNDTQFKSRTAALEELKRMSGAIFDMMETDLQDLESPLNN